MSKMITILGPTASGKTEFAARLASRLGAEIISADSRQVYRGMDIGTGKDLADYVVDGHEVPFHLIDICEPGTRYNLFRYQEDFNTAYCDIVNRGAVPILCGGTGLYIESVLKGYSMSPVPPNEALRSELADKSLTELTAQLEALKARNGSVMHNTTDMDSCQRAIRAIEIETCNLEHPVSNRDVSGVDSFIVGINIDREARRHKITARLDDRLAHGMVEEIRGLLASGVSVENLTYYGLEYKYVTAYVTGELSFHDMREQLNIAIHRFAKRQMTWFRGMERRGLHIHWIDAGKLMEDKINEVIDLWQ